MKFFWAFLILIGAASCASNQTKDLAALHMQSGISLFENGNYPLALAAFLKAEEYDKKNPVIQNNLGLTYFMREKYSTAENHLKKAIEIEPKYTDARNNLARVYLETEKYAQAENELKIVLNDLTYPAIDKAYINMGLSHFNQLKYELALSNFENALRANTSNCVAASYYGRCYFELKQYENAVKYLDKAIGLCQRALYDEPHYYSAIAYYRLGDKKKSELRFEETIKLYPNGKYTDKAKSLLKLMREGH